MAFTAHDLRYKPEESYPELYAFLHENAQKHLASLKYDRFEIDTVIGHIIEMLVRTGLLGGKDFIPSTYLESLSNERFHDVLIGSIRKKAINQLLQRGKYLIDTIEAEQTTEPKSDINLQTTDLEDEHVYYPFTREKALELAFAQALHTLQDAYFGKLTTSPDKENSLQYKIQVQTLEKPNQDFLTSSTIHIRIVEEPLTAQNFSNIISILTDLHTKCWLLANERFGDLIQYTQTRDTQLIEQAQLIITKVSHNSPADIKLSVNADTSPQSIAEAIKIGIDAIAHTPQRIKTVKIENQAKELEIKQKALEAQALLADKSQDRQIEAEKAEIDKQRALIEIDKQQIELEKQRIGLQRERLKLETERVDYALETALYQIG